MLNWKYIDIAHIVIFNSMELGAIKEKNWLEIDVEWMSTIVAVATYNYRLLSCVYVHLLLTHWNIQCMRVPNQRLIAGRSNLSPAIFIALDSALSWLRPLPLMLATWHGFLRLSVTITGPHLTLCTFIVSSNRNQHPCIPLYDIGIGPIIFSTFIILFQTS